MYYYLNLQNIVKRGIPVASRAGDTLEWTNLKTQVDSLDLPRRPKMRRELGYMELCQFLTGMYDPEPIARVAPNVDMSLFGLSAVYGPRVMPGVSNIDGNVLYSGGRDQLADVIGELLVNPMSRRAVITISAPNEPLADQPCISSMQFLLRGNQVNMSVFARSWDLWFGAPHDLIVLSGILQVVASCTMTRPGVITVTAGSGHIYMRSLLDIRKALAVGDTGGSYRNWSFQVPRFGDLDLFRGWAGAAIWDLNWLSGAPKGTIEKWARPLPAPNFSHEEVPISEVTDTARKIYQNKGNL